jgi:hypothetical protein
MDHLTDAPIANILILAGVIFLAVGLFGRVGGFIGSIFGNIEAGKNSRVLAGVLGGLLIVGGAWLHQAAHQPAPSSSGSAPVAAATTTTNSQNTPPVPSSSPKATRSPSVVPAAPHESARAKAPASQLSSKNSPPPLNDSEVPAPAAEREKLPNPPVATQPALERAAPAIPPTSVGDEHLLGSWSNLIPRSDSIKRFEIVRDAQGMNLHLWYSCPSGDCDVGYYHLDFSGSTPKYEYNDSRMRRVAYLTLQVPNVLHVRIDLFQNGSWLKRNDWVFTKSTASDRLRDALSRYLEAGGEKAFAMAPGTYSFHTRDSSLEGAKEKALRGCEERAGRSCSLILVNNDPVQ